MAASVGGHDRAEVWNDAHDMRGAGAGNITNAAASSLINGSDFGDNILQALPDTIGQTIGNAIGAAMMSSPSASIQTPQPGQGGGQVGVPSGPMPGKFYPPRAIRRTGTTPSTAERRLLQFISRGIPCDASCLGRLVDVLRPHLLRLRQVCRTS